MRKDNSFTVYRLPFTVRTLFLLSTLYSLLSTFGYAKVDMADAVKEIGEKAAQVKSYSCDFKMTVTFVSGKATMVGKLLFKEPNKSKLETNVLGSGGEAVKQIKVSDGKTLWLYIPEMKVLYKSDLTKPGALAKQPADIRKALKDIEAGTTELVKTQELGKITVYVFEGKPVRELREEDPKGYYKIRVFVGQKDGLVRKVEVLSQKNVIVMTQEYTNIKLNPTIDDNEFIFKPPANIKPEER